MKKILFGFIASLALVSCLDNGSYEESYYVYATFEYTGIDNDETFGADSIYYDTLYRIGIGYQDLIFYHSVDSVSQAFNGGALLSILSASDSLDTVTKADMYRVVGTENSTYMVWYGNPDASKMPEHDIEFRNKNYGTCTMSGCMVNNTAYVADAVRNSFEPGDKLTLKATGYLSGAKTKSVEINLAEYTVAKDSVMTVWTPFDMSSIGEVDYVDFEIVSTKEGIPQVFCMDDVLAYIELSY